MLLLSPASKSLSAKPVCIEHEQIQVLGVKSSIAQADLSLQMQPRKIKETASPSCLLSTWLSFVPYKKMRCCCLCELELCGFVFLCALGAAYAVEAMLCYTWSRERGGIIHSRELSCQRSQKDARWEPEIESRFLFSNPILFSLAPFSLALFSSGLFQVSLKITASSPCLLNGVEAEGRNVCFFCDFGCLLSLHQQTPVIMNGNQ